MKAPDKLFLHPNYRGEVGANWLTFPLTKKDECYLRKDALLEWAKGEIMPGNSAEGKGWNLALQTLIDKIESL